MDFLKLIDKQRARAAGLSNLKLAEQPIMRSPVPELNFDVESHCLTPTTLSTLYTCSTARQAREPNCLVGYSHDERRGEHSREATLFSPDDLLHPTVFTAWVCQHTIHLPIGTETVLPPLA